MPSAETRIALANLDAIALGRVLAVGVEPDVAERLSRGSTVFQFDLRAARACAGVSDVRHGTWLSGERYDSAIVVLPKESERLRMLLSMVAPMVDPGGALTVVGRNDAGIRSAGTAIAEAAAGPEVLDFRFHCRALTARVERTAEPGSLERWRARFQVEVAGRTLEVVSYPGVFSHGRLDRGTKLLIETIGQHAGARALDVGCGSGVIGAWLAIGGAQVECVDTDAYAVTAARETLDANGATGARALPSDLFSDSSNGYACVATNAPFHAGVGTTSTVASTLIREAPNHLARGGELWLVANRFLDHRRALERAFARVEVAAEDPRYRVYRARA